MAEQQSSIDPYETLKIIHNKDDDSLTRLQLFPCTTPEEQNSLPNQSMAEQQSSIDPYETLKIIHNKDDDSLTRLQLFPCTTPEEQNSLPNQSIFTKDIPLNATNKTWLRLFMPINPPPNTKLPLIVFFHGGGFIIGSASNTRFHHFCAHMVVQLPAIVISVGYRLAPENRLPAAYDDAVEALTWVRNHALGLNGDHELRNIADVSNCYLMGISAGGNIAYHAGLKALAVDLQPLVIKGLILNQPFFSGQQRSQSEMRLANDGTLPLAMCDVMWELSLPKGCDRDHEYCNPLVNGNYKDKIGLLGRCFVSARGGDLLMDRQMEFAEMLKVNGVDVVTWFNEEGYHGMDLFEPERSRDLFIAVKEFISAGNV